MSEGLSIVEERRRGERSGGDNLPGRAREPQDFSAAERRGVLIVESGGRIAVSNRMAEAVLARADAFGCENGRLRPLCASMVEPVRILIREACGGGHGMLSLPRRSGRRDYLVIASPAPEHDGARLLIVDPEDVARPKPEWLRRLFALTGAEARVAIGLLDGATLDIIARDCGASLATVRVHVAHVFRKTRTARQSELVRLLMSYPWDVLAQGDSADGRR